MPDSGAQLGVDLNQLYRTAHRLNSVANDFSSAASLINDPGPAPSGPWPTTAQSWPDLQAALYAMLMDTSKNLADSATTLNNTVNNYAATDQAAADQLRQLQQQDANLAGW